MVFVSDCINFYSEYLAKETVVCLGDFEIEQLIRL